MVHVNGYFISTPDGFEIYVDEDVIYISPEPKEYTISMLNCAAWSVCMENCLLQWSDIETWMPRLESCLLMDDECIVPSKLIERMKIHKKYTIRRIAMFLKVIMDNRDILPTKYI